MPFKVVRTFGYSKIPYEEESFNRIGAEFVVAPFPPGRCAEEALIPFVQDADAVITVFEPFTRKVIEKLEKCRVIAAIGVGYQNIDVAAATKAGICATNNPEYCLEEVSDHTMALVLALARKIKLLDETVRSGKSDYAEVAQVRPPMYCLRGQTLGLVGFGRIPRVLVPKARGFGLRLITYDPYLPPSVAQEFGVEIVDFDTLLKQSDFVSIHAALTAENYHMFGREQFPKMKPTAYLINTARGGLVDEAALYTALREGNLAGAALDVNDPEPIKPDNPLLTLKNVIVTGHSSFYSETSAVELRRQPVDQVVQVLSGERPKALLNPEVAENFARRWGLRLKGL